MKDLIILPDAEEDVRNIWTYSADTWGVLQADRYVGQLSDAFTAIALGRSAARSADHIRTGYHPLQAGRHVAFFRETEDRVVRVLHERMDVDRTHNSAIFS